jgi:hypothetical protein
VGELHSSGSGQGQLASCCLCGDEASVPLKERGGGEFFDNLGNFRFFKNNFTPYGICKRPIRAYMQVFIYIQIYITIISFFA